MEVDAAERLDLVRLLDVRRTPTVFVLGPDGRVARRGSGLMRKDEVLAALGDAGEAVIPYRLVGSDTGAAGAYHRGRAFPGRPG